MKRLFAFALSAAATTSALAGTVRYTINGTPYTQTVAPSANLTIDLGTVSTSTDILISSVDGSGNNDTTLSIGQIIIRGDDTDGWRIRVAVATSDLSSVDDAFSSFLLPLDPSFHDVGGVVFTGPLSDPTNKTAGGTDDVPLKSLL